MLEVMFVHWVCLAQEVFGYVWDGNTPNSHQLRSCHARQIGCKQSTSLYWKFNGRTVYQRKTSGKGTDPLIFIVRGFVC